MYIEKKLGARYDALVHKKCSGIKCCLLDIPDFKYHRCLGLARPIDGRPVEHV